MASWQDAPVVESGSSWKDAPVVEQPSRKPKVTAAPPKPAPKAMTREEAIKAKAREQVAKEDASRSTGSGTLDDFVKFGDSARAAAFNYGTFGVGPRIQAGVSALKDDVSYDDALAYWREKNKAETNKSLTGEVVGAVLSGGPLATAGGAAIRGVTNVLPRAGNVISRAVQMQRGQKLANVARGTVVGAGLGATQAAGEGSSVKQGAGYGAVGGGAATAIGEAGSALLRHYTRPVSGNVGRAGREIIDGDIEQLAARHAQMSGEAGNNVPVVAALDERGFQNVRNKLLRQSPEAVAAADQQAANYTRGMMDRVEGHLRNAGARTGARQFDTIEEMGRYRRDTADQIMEPIADQRLNLTEVPVQDVERQMALRAGGRVQSLGNRVQTALGDMTDAELAVAGLTRPQADEAAQLMFRMYARNPVDVTVREAEALRRLLNASASGADNAGIAIDAETFRNASRAIQDHVSSLYPEYRQMIDIYSAHSKMIEGFKHAAAGKRVADVADPAFADNLRSPEGRVGMRYGELNRQIGAATRNPSGAINTARELGDRGDLTREVGRGTEPGSVTENVGRGASDELAARSQAEYEAYQRTLQAGNVNPANQKDRALDTPEGLISGAVLLGANPSAWSKAKLAGQVLALLPTGTSRRVSENLADMLFSPNAADSQRALALLRRLGVDEQVLNTMMLPSAAGRIGGSQANPDQPPAPPAAPVEPQASMEDQQFDDLASRVEQVESTGDQSAVSSKGAVGVMQVMPGTAPEAAELAGVPYDEERYRTDEEYNRQLGRAYLQEMLKQFDGDETAAVAAYNAGPAAVRRAQAKGDNWVALLPAETQDYVQKVLGGGEQVAMDYISGPYYAGSPTSVSGAGTEGLANMQGPNEQLETNLASHVDSVLRNRAQVRRDVRNISPDGPAQKAEDATYRKMLANDPIALLGYSRDKLNFTNDVPGAHTEGQVFLDTPYDYNRKLQSDKRGKQFGDAVAHEFRHAGMKQLLEHISSKAEGKRGFWNSLTADQTKMAADGLNKNLEEMFIDYVDWRKTGKLDSDWDIPEIRKANPELGASLERTYRALEKYARSIKTSLDSKTVNKEFFKQQVADEDEAIEAFTRFWRNGLTAEVMASGRRRRAQE